MRYALYYWPEIQGRGEFVRLALEDAGARYTDVARGKGGVKKMMQAMARGKQPAYAPPFLKAGKQVIGQSANILLYLGARHRLAPRAEPERLWVHQLQLTIADLVVEAHDTHHPIGASLYYEDQKKEAKRRTKIFLEERVPKFLGYFDGVIKKSGGPFLTGRNLTYADLSLFQVIAGLRYAFPKAMKRIGKKYPRVMAVHDLVRRRPRIAAYLKSKRRLSFNQWGIFRRYKELDA